MHTYIEVGVEVLRIANPSAVDVATHATLGVASPVLVQVRGEVILQV